MPSWQQSVPFLIGKASSLVLTCSLSHASAGWNQSDCFQWASGQVFPPYWREQGTAAWHLDQKRPSDGVGTALQEQCDGEGFLDPIWWHIPRSTAWLLLQVYYFSKGTLKIANKQFTAVKNDYEMTFNNETSVMPCEDGHHLPTVQFDFTGIDDLESKSKDSLVGKSVWGPRVVIIRLACTTHWGGGGERRHETSPCCFTFGCAVTRASTIFLILFIYFWLCWIFVAAQAFLSLQNVRAAL